MSKDEIILSEGCHSTVRYKDKLIIIDFFPKGSRIHKFKWMAVDFDFTFKVFADTKNEVIEQAKQKINAFNPTTNT